MPVHVVPGRGRRRRLRAMALVGVVLATASAACPGRGTPRDVSRVPRAADSAELEGFRGQKFAIVGDYGVDTDEEAAVAALVRSWNPDFVVTTGDNNYPVGTSLTIDRNIGKYYASFIGGYSGDYGPGSATNRFWPALGNHDWYGPERVNPYTRYFSLPGNERYYDIRLGEVHLFVVDSDKREPDGNTADSPQAAWLRQRLGASDACLRLVSFHHPPHSSAAHGPAENMRWPFKAWGAHAVVNGHEHTYERFDVDGLPYFVNGLGGAPTYAFGDPQPGSVVRYNANHGAMLVRVHPGAVEYQFRDVDNRLVDRYRVPSACVGAAAADVPAAPARDAGAPPGAGPADSTPSDAGPSAASPAPDAG